MPDHTHGAHTFAIHQTSTDAPNQSRERERPDHQAPALRGLPPIARLSHRHVRFLHEMAGSRIRYTIPKKGYVRVDGINASEVLFERLCDESGLPALIKIPEQHDKSTPDYELHLESMVLVEVKEIRPNKEELQPDGVGYLPNTPGRIRKKIRRAGKQFAEANGPAVLILYDVQRYLVGSDDIRDAIYGHESVVVRPTITGEPCLVRYQLGRDRSFTEGYNTRFSAVGLLEVKEDGLVHLDVFHNCHARHPLAPDWLRGDRIRHWTIDPTVKGVPEWQET